MYCWLAYSNTTSLSESTTTATYRVVSSSRRAAAERVQLKHVTIPLSFLFLDLGRSDRPALGK
jgi:hypothetical protein